MGCWGFAPWDDDTAADWFAELMDSTGVATKVVATLKQDVDDDTATEIRAAASLVVLLGRVYVWPVDEYDEHLNLAATKLEQMLELYPYNEDEDFRSELKNEIKVLRSRLSETRSAPDSEIKEWWATWL